MSYFAKPPTSQAGHDLKPGGAPNEIWRLRIPQGGYRDVALYYAEGHKVRSNNPNVVDANKGDISDTGSKSDNPRMLRVFGRKLGSTVLDCVLRDTDAPWGSVQVQVTPSGEAAVGLHDPTTYFIKPPWSSSFAGASVTADKRLWRQELDLGGSVSVGLKGWQGITLSFNQTSMATYSTFVDNTNDLLGIDLVGLQPGNVEFIAYRAALPVASMQVFIRSTASPKAFYVDQFAVGYYDIDFRAEGGDYSRYVIVRYADDIVLPIRIDRISDAKQDPLAAKKLIDAGGVGEGGRRFPMQMNATTTPNLYALKKAAIQAMEANTVQIIRVSKEAIVFVLTIMDIARGLSAPKMAKMPRESAPAPVKQLLGEAPAGAQELKMTAEEYRAALSHVFPSQALNEVSSLVDGIGQRAAQRAAADPSFISLYRSGNMRDAGTMFHSVAAQEARAVPQSSLPSGWRLTAERTIQAGRGGSRADIFLEGPGGDLVEFDWKTTGNSALTSKTVGQMNRHSGQISTNIAGTLTTQESRSWVDFIRPLLGAPP